MLKETSKALTFVFLSTLLVPTAVAAADAMAEGFFSGSDLDFWREGKKVQPFVPPIVQKAPPRAPTGTASGVEELPPPSGSIIRQRDALPFDWSRYEDPSSPEFWDDGGDYVAPRPLREAVANPTPENLQRYTAWQAKRLAVIAVFGERLAQFGAGVTSPVPTGPSGGSLARSAAPANQAATRIPWRELDLLYFYQSSCPHCRAEKEHVEDLARRGVRVSFVQLDAGDLPPLHPRSVPYTASLSMQFGITATPTWVFRYRGQVLRLEGEQPEPALASQISSLLKTSRNPQ
jgi:thiol-disulfide isomerase/thioredoxin